MSQSGERTEEATPRRLEKARKDGRIVSSRYWVMGVQFTVAFLYFSGAGASLGPGLRHWRSWLSSAFDASLSIEKLLEPSLHWTKLGLLYCFWAGLLTSSSVLVSHLLVSQGYFSLSRVKPDFSKLFSASRLGGQLKEGLKSLRAGIFLIFLAVLFATLYGRELLTWSIFLARLSLSGQIAEQSRQYFSYGKLCCLLFFLVGAADLLQAMRTHRNQLKMSKQELKEEFKESNGSPHVKAKIRKMMKDFTGKRMMQQLPKATVVITNPTHYAIAIQYKPEEMNVPLVLAKGVDHVALRIRKVAMSHEIPIVENKPLAQALYKSVEVGQEIPMDLYRAVAEVLAYVYRVLGRHSQR
ncbi:EscU/YscU/HrcU family type III secretion system export apparatus switch protein [Bryobacter aggregatus]|uniref:EscU/YscU/HrcU family type III secretion system export apparatus switch protein n=1 Tax=Bryobacter aggregatus TaxID=360054 RepID=UPI0004E27FE9|nr:EscU/YscU/HrcU family type III secretion system export apparatus switch protein [Bryobacter aggregatus]